MRPCPGCGAPQHTLPVAWRNETRYLWRPCACREADLVAAAERDQARRASFAQRQADPLFGAAELERLEAQRMTMATFRPAWLAAEPGQEHPHTVATAWLAQALAYGPRALCRDQDCPPAVLYCYSPVRGCGKTHLAAALGLLARAEGRRVAFVDEHHYLGRYWSCVLPEQARLVEDAGERAWLTIIDDLGRRRVRQGQEQAEDVTAVADAWDALLNRRFALGGWTIITSNVTPTELLNQGTINRSTFSRIGQMTAQRIVRFRGIDRRLSAG